MKLRRWFAAPLLLVPGVALGLAIAFTVTNSSGTTAQTVTYRWGDVTIEALPETVDFVRDFDPDTGEPYISIITRTWPGESARIDKMGRVVGVSTLQPVPGDSDMMEEVVLTEASAELKELLSKVKFDPLDVSTAPWPYNGSPPAQRVKWGKISFAQPDPGSGFRMSVVYADFVKGGSSGPSLARLETTRSILALDANTGEVLLREVHPDDEEAVAHLLATLQVRP